jgi:hypothetical protein
LTKGTTLPRQGCALVNPNDFIASWADHHNSYKFFFLTKKTFGAKLLVKRFFGPDYNREKRMMKSIFATIVLATIGLLASAPSYGAEQTRKVYLDPNKIHFSETSIIYKTSHGDLPIKSLRSDKTGVYTVIRRMKNATKGLVFCPICKRFVDEDDYWHFLFH